MAERRRRSARIREGWPSAYDTSPRGSALGELLDAVARALERLDADTEVVLRNRWPRIARESAPPGAPDALARQRAPLTQLGRLVGVVPTPDEPLETFRGRILTQARQLRAGLTTPRAILALSSSALGLELCPRLEKRPAEGGSRTTVGWGMRPGSLAACGPDCGRRATCGREAGREAQLLLIDNPPDPRSRLLPGIRAGDRLDLHNESLEDAQPALRLSVPEGGAPVAWPALQRDDETLFFAGVLRPGHTLIVTPYRAGDDSSGRAVMVSADGATVLPPDAVVYFTTSARFEDDPPPPDAEARFAPEDAGPLDEVTRFARFGESVLRTPLLPSGQTTWDVLQLNRKALEDMLGSDEVSGRFPTAPDMVVPQPFDLQLDWVVYPDCTFQLRIPRNAAVREAERYGGIALVREMVELARGAGIGAWVDFPQEQDLPELGPEADDAGWVAGIEPAWTETLEPAVGLDLEATARFAEPHPLDDAWTDADGARWYPVFQGVFAADDQSVGTRFNGSHFAPEEG